MTAPPTPPRAPSDAGDFSAYDLLDVAVARVDAQGRMTAANTAFQAFTRLEPAQWSGRGLDEVLCGPDTDPAQRLWIHKRLRESQSFAPIEFTGQDGRGQALHCRLGLRIVDQGALFTLQPAATEHRLRTELRQTTELLTMAQDFGRFGVWSRDLQTMSGQWDPHIWQIWGQPPREGSPSFDDVVAQVLPPDQEAVVTSFRASTRRCGSYSVRYRVRRPDGQVRHVAAHWEIRPGPDGLPARALGILLDETEPILQSRRTAELAQRLEMATSAAGVAIWGYEADSHQLHWDRQMHLLHGNGEGAVPPSVDAYIERYVHPADRLVVREALLGLMARGSGMVELDLRLVRPDGSERRVASRTAAEAGPGGTHLYGVMLDVTERHAAQAHLRDAAERVALVTRAVGIGTWQSDPDGTLAWWDEQMFRLRGLSPRDGPMTPTERAAPIHPQDLAAAQAELRAAIAEDRISNAEFRVSWPDGSVHWLASRSTPVRDETGRTVRRIGINWDITDARAAAEAQHQTTLALLESQAKSKFLARMSHELRTPLNAVLGFAQLLLTESERTDDVLRRRRIEHIHAAGEHLLSLINDVLDLSSLESGELPLQPAAVPLGGLVRTVLPLVEAMAQRQEVRIDNRLPDAAHAGAAVIAAPGLAVRADPMRLRQVLINLLSNAVKYNRRGGSVTIEAGVDATATPEVWLRVSDTGRGLTAEQMRHIFEPFNRLGAQDAGIEGTGIGLAIVQASVQRMGGRIAVRSTPGQGSCFEVRLPRAELPPQPAEAAAPGAPAATARRDTPAPMPQRVLYIEDNAVNQLIVSELLARRRDLVCDLAADGAQGVERARATRPALILVDMQLPDIDGYEVLRRLRADPLTAGIRCVALSANAMPEDIRQARAAGFDDYWTKPVDFARFNAALDALFGPAP